MSLLNRMVATALPAVPKPIVRYFSRPYIAGETIDDMVKTVRGLNADGYLATVDILGELAKSSARAEAAGEEYLRVMDEMVERGLKAKVSVKLTQMGLKLDKELARRRGHRRLRRAVACRLPQHWRVHRSMQYRDQDQECGEMR